MKKVISYLAISLNGKIARSDGQVDWLDKVPNPEKSDYGYYKFYDGIDTTIMGRNTFDLLESWDVPFPYPDKKNYVLTSTDLKDNEYVKTINLADVENLKKEKGKDIWLIGGGITNTVFLQNKLIDELILHIMPIIIPEGINLFEYKPSETNLHLISSQSYSSGVIELHYKIVY